MNSFKKLLLESTGAQWYSTDSFFQKRTKSFLCRDIYSSIYSSADHRQVNEYSIDSIEYFTDNLQKLSYKRVVKFWVILFRKMRNKFIRTYLCRKMWTMALFYNMAGSSINSALHLHLQYIQKFECLAVQRVSLTIQDVKSNQITLTIITAITIWGKCTHKKTPQKQKHIRRLLLFPVQFFFGVR